MQTHLFDGQFEALKAGVRRFVERPRVRSFADKATETIKAHPIAAVTAALGLGYIVVRMARR